MTIEFARLPDRARLTPQPDGRVANQDRCLISVRQDGGIPPRGSPHPAPSDMEGQPSWPLVRNRVLSPTRWKFKLPPVAAAFTLDE
jgi:hypothetical protein